MTVRQALADFDAAPRKSMKPSYEALRAVCLDAGMPAHPFRVVQWARDRVARDERLGSKTA